MKIVRLSLLFLAGSCLWAGYQSTYTNGLTSIDPSKWSQTGSLSTTSTGLTGNGALVSSVAVPTGNDYDIRLTIHTDKQGACTGSYSLYGRSNPSNTTAYVLTANATSVSLYREVAGAWTLLSFQPFACSDGAGLRLVVRGSAITFWSGPNPATYQDSAPIAAGQPGIGIDSSSGDSVGDVQIGPIDYLPPTPVNASTIQTSAVPNRVDLRWAASSADANSVGLQGYVIYRDGIYLGSPRTPNWIDQTVTGAETTTYSICAADQHGTLSSPTAVTVAVPDAVAASTAKPGAGADLRRPTAKSVPTGPSVDQREVGVRTTGSYWGAAGENIDLLSGNLNFSIPLIKAMGRGNSSVTFALSYNSQMWRQDANGNVWPLGEDVGCDLNHKMAVLNHKVASDSDTHDRLARPKAIPEMG
jgi:hypothetical protein